MNRSSEIDMERLAENLLVFDQLIARATSTGSVRLDVRDVIDDVKLNSSVAKMAVELDDLDVAIAAVRLDDDNQILSPVGGATGDLPPYDELGQQEVAEDCPKRTISVLKRFVELVKTEFGLLVLLVLYSFIGATTFYYMEHECDLKLERDLLDERRLFAERIWNVTHRGHDEHHRHRHHPHHHHPLDTNVSQQLLQQHRHHHHHHHHRHQDNETISNWTTAATPTSGTVSSTSLTSAFGDAFNDYTAIEELLDQYVKRKEVIRPNSKPPGWSFWGALFYCGTVFTTVGYGHIVPVTDAGRITTMVYAVFGIPLCLVVLASLGRLLTRSIKHLWSFVLLFYYTGSVRRVRHMIPISRLRMSLMQRVRDRIHRRTLRRLVARQQSNKTEGDGAAETDACVATTAVEAEAELRRLEVMDKVHVVSFEVNDKFNLPPIVALTIAVAYILLGVVIYRQWERWSYLEAFYFVFISLSTVGFGDILPEHPKFFLASSVYVLIGLALVAMVITVVMETVNSTIEIAKDKVYLVGRRIADVAQMQTERLAHHHPCMFKERQQTMAVQGLVFKPKRFGVFKPKQFHRRCSV